MNKKIKKLQNKILATSHYSVFGEIIGCNDDYELINKLLKYLEYYSYSTDEIDDKCATSLTRASDFLLQIISDNKIKSTEIPNRFIEIKQPFIRYIKKFNKKDRAKSMKVSCLRNVIDNLDKIEVISLDYIDNTLENINDDLITYVIFKERNYNVSSNLIKNYPYLINLYSRENGNILKEVVDKYLRYLVLSFTDEKYKDDITYYSKIIRILLTTNKIKIDDEIIDKIIMKLDHKFNKNIFNDELEKEYREKISDLKHLIQDPSCLEDEEYLNRIYNININIKSYDCDKFTIMKEEYEKLLATRKKVDDRIITIDEENTHDRDDALSIIKIENGYRIGVHISDVNALINLYPELKEEIIKRGTSIYLPDKVINMLPVEMIQELCSLDENKPRLVRSYYFDIDDNFKITNFFVEKGYLEVDDNLSYKEVDKIINKKSDKNILKLSSITSSLRSLHFDNKEWKFVLGNNDNLTSSQKMIETLMVLTGKYMAQFMQSNNHLFVYRTVDTNQHFPLYLKVGINTLDRREHDYYEKVIKQHENLMVRGKYSINPLKHEELGDVVYSHISSPNRRAADILANDCVDSFIFSEDIKISRCDLKEKVDVLNIRNDQVLDFYKSYSLVKKKVD